MANYNSSHKGEEIDNAVSAVLSKEGVWDAKATVQGASVTLLAGGWNANEQTVSVNGVTTENIVVASSSPESFLVWSEAMCICSRQGDGELTFTCQNVPSTDVTANIMIVG